MVKFIFRSFRINHLVYLRVITCALALSLASPCCATTFKYEINENVHQNNILKYSTKVSISSRYQSELKREAILP